MIKYNILISSLRQAGRARCMSLEEPKLKRIATAWLGHCNENGFLTSFLGLISFVLLFKINGHQSCSEKCSP